jgi:hypothetical protein
MLYRSKPAAEFWLLIDFVMFLFSFAIQNGGNQAITWKYVL